MFRYNRIQNLSRHKFAELSNSTPLFKPVSDYFNELVFDYEAKKKYLPDDIIEKLDNSIDNYVKLEQKVTDIIAMGVKNWAVDNGVTHYTHWFQPLNGRTSEKHDTFFKFDKNWNAIEHLSGTELVIQEPDGSSFPTGGLRNTYQARSYTLWDPSSPFFIRKTKFGRTLCIPAILVSYTGESLDMKAPLLKSIKLIDQIATKVCNLFDTNITKVSPTLGWEQEYFVVDEQLYNARPDLVLCGRTLFGNASARNQQLADHYFGSIPERVYNFIIEFEQEALQLGIPIKTRHNEVAPNQFECAPHFEYCNIATDHNLLLMDNIDSVAKRHGLRVLLHEKPFSGINGSGKHNNWSLATNTGINLLEPGNNPQDNILFLTFFINIIKAIYDNGDLLRASIANAGNEHRLGAHEAPPAIISVFIGEFMQDLLDKFLNNKKNINNNDNNNNIDFSLVPFEKLHLTDRNRTSPFPFTSNKFEFRACGSSANVSQPVTILNTIIADQLNQFYTKVTELINQGIDKNEAIQKTLKQEFINSKDIIFDGNNYSKEWIEEAKRRNLPNLLSTPEALSAMLFEKNIDILVRNNIFNKEEIEARYRVALEEYINKIEIEALLIDEIAHTIIIPSVVNYQNELINNVQGLKNLGFANESQQHTNQLIKISNNLEGIITNLEKMEELRNLTKTMHIELKAKSYSEDIKPLFDLIRNYADKLELIVDDKHWQLPKYRELLFLH